LLGLGFRRDRTLGRAALDRLGVRDAFHHGTDADLQLLADQLCSAGDDDVEALDLADTGMRIVQADLAELELELLPDCDRRLRLQALDVTAVEHAEVVEVDGLEADEEEAALGELLELT